MAIVSDAEVAEFRERGFLPARPLLNSSELEDLRAAFEDLKEGRSAKKPELSRNLTGDGENVVLQIVNAWEAEPAFQRHLFHPALTEAVAKLMDAEVVRVWHDQIQYKPPCNGGPTVWHQDFPYWPVLEPADLVSAWVALEDADEANGCMSMVPGSHRWGAYRDGTIGLRAGDWGPDFDRTILPREAQVEVVPSPARAGEVMFHHCMTWHGAPPNRSERGRPAIAVHYMPGWTRFVPKAGHPVDHLIEVAPGEVLKGAHFPTVFDRVPLPPPGPEHAP
jgi:ectoine hydroxylase-related dioxygenase (phytanoyl-CoA dioxygenase family)